MPEDIEMVEVESRAALCAWLSENQEPPLPTGATMTALSPIWTLAELHRTIEVGGKRNFAAGARRTGQHRESGR